VVRHGKATITARPAKKRLSRMFPDRDFPVSGWAKRKNAGASSTLI
jgi:hypothetical protein